MSPAVELSDRLKALLEVLAQEGLAHAAQGLSAFVGQKIALAKPKVTLMPIERVPDVMGGPETLAVGIYLLVRGDLDGHIMLLLQRENAVELVDLLLDQAPGTTQQMGPLERSALAEVGNVCGSLFLNSVALLSGLTARPSPPAVMEDMVGAILDVIVAQVCARTDDIVVIETVFEKADRKVEALFWVIPDLDTLSKSLT